VPLLDEGDVEAEGVAVLFSLRLILLLLTVLVLFGTADGFEPSLDPLLFFGLRSVGQVLEDFLFDPFLFGSLFVCSLCFLAEFFLFRDALLVEAFGLVEVFDLVVVKPVTLPCSARLTTFLAASRRCFFFFSARRTAIKSSLFCSLMPGWCLRFWMALSRLTYSVLMMPTSMATV